LSEPTPDLDGPPPGGGAGEKSVVPAWRRWFRVVFLVLACVSITISAVGMWTRAVLLDTSVYVDTVDGIPSNEAVATELSDYLTQQIFTALGVEDRVANLLPDEADPLAAPLTAAVRSYIQDQVQTFLQSNQFNKLWVQVNTRAHKQVVLVLRGGGDIVSTKNGEVTLNVIPLINEILQELASSAEGFFGFSGKAPEIKEGMLPDDMRKQIESALDVKLPDQFGEIVIFESDQLGSVQDAVRIFDDFVFYLGLFSLLCVGATIALATDRRGAVLRLSLGSAIGFWLLLALVNVVKDEVAHIPKEPEAQDAARAVVDTSTQLLVDALRLLTAIGVIVALVLWLSGPGERASKVRAWLSKWGAKTETGRNIGTWIVDHVDALRLGGIALGFVLLLIFDVRNWLGLIAVISLVAAYEFALGFVRRSSAANERA